MGLISDILGWKSAPSVADKYDSNGYTGNDYSAGDDKEQEITYHFRRAKPLPMVPYFQIPEPGDTLSNRAYGTHTLIPGRPWSAQTRLKNMKYELPADGWTQNPDGAAYILRTPGLPGVVQAMPSTTHFTTQPEFLQPVVNLQIQNEMNWIQQFQAKIMGLNPREMAQNDMENMFPSVFNNPSTMNQMNNPNG